MFLRSGATTLIAILVVSSLVAGAWADDSVTLRYRLKANATYEQISTSKLTVKIEVDGGPQDQMAMMQQMLGGGMEQRMRQVTHLIVGAPGGDGSMPLEITLKKMEQSLSMGGREMPMPNLMANQMNRIFKGNIGADGRSLQVDEMSGLPPGVAQQLMNIMPRYPDTEVSVGEKFEIPISATIPMPTAGGEVDMKGNAIYTLEKLEGDKAHFSVRQTFSIGVGSEGADAGAMSMVGGGLGTAIYDQTEGIFISTKMDMDFQIGLKMGGGMVPSSGGEAASGMAGTSMKIKMSGPVEMSIRRIPSGN